MFPGTVPIAAQKTLEDPLAYLPCSTIAGYRKGEIIFGPCQPSQGIYLVIDGKVSVSRIVSTGHEVAVDIYMGDEFFGESSLLGDASCHEQAVAIESTKVMTWAAAEIERLVQQRPRLGLALAQILAQRSLDFSRRVASFTVDHIDRRLARSLLRLAERLGETGDDGVIRMVPLTHQTLSHYVGTSREVVTHFMIEFRRRGFLRYSRKEIALNAGPLREWLRHKH
jgi:CRP-like cAMP-binding protein